MTSMLHVKSSLNTLANGKHSYARIPQVLDLPPLVEIQLRSFRWFKTFGLAELLEEISPILDFTGNRYELSFYRPEGIALAPGDFDAKGFREHVVGRVLAQPVANPDTGEVVLDRGTEIDDAAFEHILASNAKRIHVFTHYFRAPKYTVDQCREKEITYSAPLYVTTSLKRKDTSEEALSEIFMGDVPLMTLNGTFIINGAERVVVSQLVRSPGVYFTTETDLAAERPLAGAKLIPYRGAWLEFETSSKDVLSVKVDRKRKVPLTTFLRAIGLAYDDEIVQIFKAEDKEDRRHYLAETLRRDQLPDEGREASFREDDLRTAWNAVFVGNPRDNREPWWPSQKDRPYDHDAARRIVRAQLEFYRRLRPGEPPSSENARVLLDNLMYAPRRYDLGRVGRYKMNRRLGLDPNTSRRTLSNDDMVQIVRTLLRVNNGDEKPDDIDHLGNRRVRAVGEPVQNQMRVGLLRMERMVKERMTLVEPENATPASLVNIRPVVAAIREFFGGSQLSQFMDQTNPLAELTHKRRLSALGPGGLSRERAGFDVRDVHHSHYGRICPIETPEGPNIGLLSSLATYARINDYGFIESPYRRVHHAMRNSDPDLVGRRVTEDLAASKDEVVVPAGEAVSKEAFARIKALSKRDVKVRPFVLDLAEDIVYMAADEEERHVVAQANISLNERGEIVGDRVEVRVGERAELESVDRVDFMDVSPMQIVSVSASLIPFLEHDDANRALMGSNMQRQAVPLLRPEAPLVGTGIEGRVARDSGQVVMSTVKGVVDSVDGREVVVKDEEGNLHPYSLTKFARSNQGTCLNQRPIVDKGDLVEPGAVLADSTSTEQGDLALGQNVLCAFMSWEGYNYEDAIILSEELVRQDKFTSVHIEKYEMEARETKLGPEEITRDIPNVGEDALRDLDEEGIIRVGAEVRPGDILVGKVTPKGETELTAEEKLLRAIFGEKSRDVKDTSLRVPHGERGKVIDVKVLTKAEKDDLPPGVNKAVRVWVAQTRKVSVGDKMAGRHGNKGVVSRIMPLEDMPFLPNGAPVNIILNPIGVPSRMNLGQVLETHLGWAVNTLGYRAVTPVFDGARDVAIEDELARAWFVRASGAIDPTGTVTHTDSHRAKVDEGKVREWLAEHGYDFDALWSGRKVGDAARACRKLWLAEEAGLDPVAVKKMNDDHLQAEVLRAHRERQLAPPILGKMPLIDGRTGEAFDQPVTVGYIYMMKLIHLVEDKIHARSTGPYSLITQQPLGGKAQFGGQRFGEMEVWALQAYSAAYNLQEMLTVKSDDVTGRVKTYEAIVKGEDVIQPGVPESFNVLLKELQSLCLAVELRNEVEPPLALPVGGEPEDLAGLERESLAAPVEFATDEDESEVSP